MDAIQGDAGTSANMNMNEVIANRAGELLGSPKGSYVLIHPNDHVNMAQSTNDVIPSAGKLTVLDLLVPLEKSLARLEKELSKKAEEFDDVITMGALSFRMLFLYVLDKYFMVMHRWFSEIENVLKKVIKKCTQLILAERQ